jgi:hypothetical protein
LILKHLIDKTGIKFRPLNMDVPTLCKYRKYWKTLSESDKYRLRKLNKSDYADTIKFMLDNNCKLEQEALDVK